MPTSNPTGVADISVTKTADVDVAIPRQEITYTITISNAGPDTAVAPFAMEILPPNFVYGFYSLDLGNTWLPNVGIAGIPGTGGAIELPDIPAGGKEVILVRGTVGATATGSLVNNVFVRCPNTTDPDHSNNRDSHTITLTTAANLNIACLAVPARVLAGQNLTYDVVVLNSGPDPAVNTVVSDSFPTALLNPQYTLDNGATWDDWTGSANIGTVDAGASYNLQIRGTVDHYATGNITNQATVKSDTPDPYPDTNYSELLTTPIYT
ncbi:MAG: DUF11 domain-containing protein [Turicibacter sp.]|nr:DUF11 domain-containing protein [Turicibacter sp.]